jgi:hypothetical protein
MDVLIDATEVAALLKVKVSWVRDHTTRVEPILPHVKLGRKVRYQPSQIIAFVQNCHEDRPNWKRQ